MNTKKYNSLISKNSKKKKTSKIILLLIMVFFVYLFLDYLNIPEFIGISSTNLNIDIFSALFNAVIVLILYVISFYYIENRQNEKDNNAIDIVDVLIKKTYQECLENLRFLDNREMIGNYIIPKVDGNKPDSENKVIHNLQTLPFSSFDAVIDLAANGYVEKEKIENYLDIKKEYQYLVSIKITFFDMDNPETLEQKAMYNNIQARDSAKLNDFLGTQINSP